MNFLKKQKTKKCFGITHRGKVRQNNEDYISYNEKEKYFIVADGMGGHNAGEIASEEAVKFIEKKIKQENILNKEDIEDSMNTLLCDAHSAVIEKSKANSEYRGMGCTISVVLIENNNILHTSHIGDSRIYLINDESIEQIGTDHSVIAQAVKNGQMTEEEARQSNLKHKLTMALGAEVEMLPEYVSRELKEGDKIIICSDGLWDMISDQEIKNTCDTCEDAKEICNLLLEKVLEAGGLDNVSIITVLI